MDLKMVEDLVLLLLLVNVITLFRIMCAYELGIRENVDAKKIRNGAEKHVESAKVKIIFKYKKINFSFKC